MNFLKTYFRGIGRNKSHFIITVLGLSIAMTVVILIFLYVNNEFSYDRSYRNADNIYRITTRLTAPRGSVKDAISSSSFAYDLKKNCPEVEHIACVGRSKTENVKYGQRSFRIDDIRQTTPGIFPIFTYHVLQGNEQDFLKEPNTAVLTENLAKKLFGMDDPLGKTVSFDDKKYTISGVIQDLPENTDLSFTALLSSPVNGSENLLSFSGYVYLLARNITQPELQTRVDQLTDRIYKPVLTGGNADVKIKYFVQPLRKIHFDNSYLLDTPKGNKTVVWSFLWIGVIILIIACISFMNLTIARAPVRSKEMMIKRISGSGKFKLIFQLIKESALTSSLSMVLSVILVILLLPAFNHLTTKHFEGNSLLTPVTLAVIAIIFLIVGGLSGIYPAIFQYILVRKNRPVNTIIQPRLLNFSKILITIQFALSIALISTILMVTKQINFMENANLGFNQSHILTVKLNFKENNRNNVNTLKNALAKNPRIIDMATGGGGTQLGTTGEWRKIRRESKNANNKNLIMVENIPSIDENYLDLFHIKLKEGRNFSPNIPTDYNESAIINETYAKKMCWTHPIGKSIDFNPLLKVIGVVKDFHFTSLHNQIEPLVFRFNSQPAANLFLKAPPSELVFVRSTWKKLFPGLPFKYEFVDKNFERQYQSDVKQRNVLADLGIIAILLTCLGLYGLVSFFLVRRTKEIGIRKVNGAKITEVMALLNKDFILWTFIAFILACPVAWYIMSRWLQNFAYKTNVSWWIFALAGVLALGIALLTVSFQSWKAATRNPVEALRYE